MKKILSVISSLFLIAGCNTNTIVENDNLLKSRIPDVFYFNTNNKLSSDTLFLVSKNDTISLYSYDSLGRYCYYNYKKMFSRREYLNYFGNTDYPIYKRIKVDYSLSYLSSLVRTNNDTIKSFWYYEFGEIQDTFIYIFNKNKIVEMISSSLNDYEKLKLRRIFSYNGDELNKIVAFPISGEKSGFGKLDSIVVTYEHKEKLVSKITEAFYCKNKEFNHKNTYFFNEMGIPNKLTMRDTMDFEILHKK